MTATAAVGVAPPFSHGVQLGEARLYRGSVATLLDAFSGRVIYRLGDERGVMALADWLALAIA